MGTPPSGPWQNPQLDPQPDPWLDPPAPPTPGLETPSLLGPLRRSDLMPIPKTGLKVIGEASYYLILERGLRLAGPR